MFYSATFAAVCGLDLYSRNYICHVQLQLVTSLPVTCPVGLKCRDRGIDPIEWLQTYCMTTTAARASADDVKVIKYAKETAAVVTSR